jgi:hypothetical protein
MLDRLGRVIDWLAFGIIIITILMMASYKSIGVGNAMGFSLMSLPSYFVLQLMMYIVRGKVRFLPW